MDDLINRQAAIDALKNVLVSEELEYAIPVLEELPPEEQKTGKWLWDKNETYYRSSECGHLAYETLYCMDGTYAYCPFCGAKMEGGEDE